MGVDKIARSRQKQLPVLFALIGLILFINLFSATEFSFLSVLVEFELEFTWPGQTRILLPPMGELKAKTHWLPISLNMELRNVDLNMLRNLVFANPQSASALFEAIQTHLNRIFLFFTLKLMFLAACGAVFALIVIGVRELRLFSWAIAASLIFILFLSLGLYYSYDIHAFEDLEYQGMLEVAPWALNLAWQSLEHVEELGGRIQDLARNLYSVLQQFENLAPPSLTQTEIVALHVSDIHNNPVAYDFVQQVITSFPVDFILDTGDLTDWGTALETEIISRIEDLDVPYLFVSGNHDSPAVLNRIESLENGVVITESGERVFDLWIAGVGDPVAFSNLPEPASLGDLNSLATEINEKWTQSSERPDIFMVHNHRVAEAILPGLFPIVVYGHNHEWRIKQKENTVYLNAGTTGAAGIRGFQTHEIVPYSLSLLYFQRDSNQKLVLKAVDGVQVTGLGMGFSLQRTFFDHGRTLSVDGEI